MVQCAECRGTVHEGGVLTCRERAAGEVYGSVRCASGACIHLLSVLSKEEWDIAP